jgi:recombination protein RecR
VAAKGGVSRDLSAGYPASVAGLIERFAELPGVGRRTAERLALHILKQPPEEAKRLARAVDEVKDSVRHCRVCFNFADGEMCAICADAKRDRARVMVVEQPGDLIALEQTGMWRGVFHVLMGRVSPLEGVGPEDVTIGELLARVDEPARNAGGVSVSEVVLALNPTLEGDGTGLVLREALAERGVSVTRLARGLPAGGQVSLSNKAVLADAIEGRR